MNYEIIVKSCSIYILLLEQVVVGIYIAVNTDLIPYSNTKFWDSSDTISWGLNSGPESLAYAGIIPEFHRTSI